MSEALARPKKVRAGHRSSATRLMRQLEGEYGIDGGPTLTRLMQCKLSLNEKLDRLRELNQEILALVEDDEIESEIEQADQFTERIQQAVIRLEHKINEREPSSTLPRSVSPIVTTSSDTATTTGSDTPLISRDHTATSSDMPLPAHHTTTATPDTSTTLVTSATVTPVTHHAVAETSSSRIKLPKLEPKKFNGDLTKWEAFWSSFESSIHVNPTLTAVDKFQYLISLLEGPAFAAVAGLKLTEPNYNEAIDTLTKRFGNKQLIISRHMDTLLELEPVTAPTNIKALRRLYDKIEFQVRSLKSLGVPLDSYGNLLSSLFMTRLPHEFRLIVSREIGTAEWTVDQIMNIVDREIGARERAFIQTSSHAQGLNPGLSTVTAMMAGDGKPKCCYCKQHHPSASCKTVTDVAQRIVILKKSGRCFICLKRHHMSRNCRSTVSCSLCNGRHHISICKQHDSNGQSAGGSGNSSAQSRTVSSSTTQAPLTLGHTPSTTTGLYCVNSDTPVLLQTAQAYVHKPTSPACGVTIRLMLDGGSQRSYITERVREALGLESEGTEVVNIKTFGSETTKLQSVDSVTATIHSKEGNQINVLFSTVPLICEPLSCQPVAYTRQQYRHLSELDLADSSSVGDELHIDALIGSDHYWQLVTGRVVRGDSGPTAIHTHLGWVLSGPVGGTSDNNHSNLHSSHSLHILHSSDSSSSLDSSLKAFWELESLGIKQDEPSVYEEFKKNIEFKNGRYEVGLPWRTSQKKLPSNFTLAKKRLEGLLNRLRHNPDVRREYHAVIQDQLRQGIIEEVNEDPQTNTDAKVHYLPHHAVIRKDKQTTKLRIVYDASARSNGISLNDSLFSGPKFNQNILDIIVRFRTYRIALAADVEKAFLMVSVCNKDRDALRFLWVDNVEKDHTVTRKLRFTRVVFGVNASPFLLNATITHHLQKYREKHPDLVHTLMKSIYVDDVTFGADREDKAYQLYVLSKKVFAEGGFNLRKFVTNSPILRQRIASSEHQFNLPTSTPSNHNVVEEDSTYASNLLAGSTLGSQKILGVGWNPVSDLLEFDIREIAKSLRLLKPTKRNIVGFASRFYDPLGFLSPVIVTLKIFFQELCKLKVNWDDPLPNELMSKWTGLVSRFQGIVITLPRCYLRSAGENPAFMLHGFCDASSAAYAAVVYLSVNSESAHFVASKTRVSPLTQLSIPRLELLSCLLLARLMSHIFEAIHSTVDVKVGSCFTDSKVALYWIQGEDKHWKQFVHNRAVEIRKLVPVHHWSHCTGKDNPADMPSRGISPIDLETNLTWRHGPDWLPKFSSAELNDDLLMPEDCITEMRSNANHTLLVATENSSIGQVMDCSHYGKLQKLLRVTVLLKKFAAQFKKLVKRDNSSIDWTVTAADMESAEIDWITDCQKQLIKDPKFELWKTQLDLFLDKDNVWRCGGRLKKAHVSYARKHPILLSKQHHLAVLIVRDAHVRTSHSGVKDTLTDIRSQYWFVKGRQFVRKLIHQCVTCRKLEGPSYKAVPPPPLPEFRVTESPPFAYSGVDFAGPLYIKQGDLSDGSSKVWIALFTCCVTRAVHLELVPDLTAQTFLRSFKRFTARRGIPSQIVSDNAKTFVSAAQTLERLFDNPEVQQYLSGLKVKWNFNLEKAPWWGGFFERLIQSMKRCLRKSIGKARLTLDELTTVVVQVEAILNSRPISYVSSEDLEEPLTPSHLLTGYRLLCLPDGSAAHDTDEEFEMTSHDLVVRAQNLTRILDQFWNRWRDEYLLQLRERYCTSETARTPRAPVLDEVVLIHEEGLKRTQWRLGRVHELVKSSDGQIRGVVLKVNCNGRVHILRRPVQCLYPLEVAQRTVSDDELQSQQDTEDKPISDTRYDKPVREAAVQARQRVRDWTSELTDII